MPQSIVAYATMPSHRRIYDDTNIPYEKQQFRNNNTCVTSILEGVVTRKCSVSVCDQLVINFGELELE